MLSLILVMVCAIAAGWLANRVQVPYPIVLVVVGIGLGVAHDWPGLDPDPELVLAIVLPAILYPASLDTSWRDFRKLLAPILRLAIGLVAMTTLAVGVAFKWLVPEVPWAVAFALGAIVSPPDAVAATAVLQRFRLPRRIVTLLEGESLVNDATGLVLYRFAVVAVLTGAFSGWSLVGQFGVIALGGLALGLATGWLTARLQGRRPRRRRRDLRCGDRVRPDHPDRHVRLPRRGRVRDRCRGVDHVPRGKRQLAAPTVADRPAQRPPGPALRQLGLYPLPAPCSATAQAEIDLMSELFFPRSSRRLNA